MSGFLLELLSAMGAGNVYFSSALGNAEGAVTLGAVVISVILIPELVYLLHYKDTPGLTQL